jgi:hypothetical protein
MNKIDLAALAEKGSASFRNQLEPLTEIKLAGLKRSICLCWMKAILPLEGINSGKHEERGFCL